MAEIRVLRPGDEELVRRLGEERALTADAAERLLADPSVRYLVAFEDGKPVGWVFGYVLNRRRSPDRSFFVYDVEVDERFRRRGIGGALLAAAAAEAQAAGCAEGFVLTDHDNEAALALYRSAGGAGAPVVELDFDYRVVGRDENRK